jgi:hypothetical protein
MPDKGTILSCYEAAMNASCAYLLSGNGDMCSPKLTPWVSRWWADWDHLRDQDQLLIRFFCSFYFYRVLLFGFIARSRISPLGFLKTAGDSRNTHPRLAFMLY